MADRRILVKTYFLFGLSNKEILTCLAQFHNIIISIRTLKRITHSLGLYRRKQQSDILDVALFILDEIQAHGQMYGYRWMHSRCKENGFVISQNDVRLLMGILDKENVAMRKKNRLQRRHYFSNGPNAVWHIDGYDKLKPYGISIHGCIDGFSRKVLWLEAGSTNKNPAVVANYFINTILKVSGCPQRVRADEGTENAYIAKMQRFLRSDHDDAFNGDKSYMAGKSVHNQRIEWFWGHLRREGIQFWMNMFQDLKENGDFDGGFLDRNLIAFCFLSAVQDTLYQIENLWNRHKIRKSTNHIMPQGRPFIMFDAPHMYGAMNCLCPADDVKLDACKESCIAAPPYDEHLSELCLIILADANRNMGSTPDDCLDTYKFLREEILALLDE